MKALGEMADAGPLFKVVYADPPWHYNDSNNQGQRGAAHKYALMPPSEIAALPVRNIVARDACLFLWVTMPQLPVAFGIMEAWGFKYKTVAFTWMKTTSTGALFFGLGHWTRANAELCLLGTRGKPKRVSASVSQAVMSNVGRHSTKPPLVRHRIVELCGDVPRIEMFARENTPGWTTWGTEAPEENDRG